MLTYYIAKEMVLFDTAEKEVFRECRLKLFCLWAWETKRIQFSVHGVSYMLISFRMFVSRYST